MDPMGIAGMVFVLIVIAMVSGFILLLPISRRLGAYLEQRLQAGRAADSDSVKMADVRELLLSLQAQVDRVAERQEFTERLLAERSEGSVVAGPPGERH